MVCVAHLLSFLPPGLHWHAAADRRHSRYGSSLVVIFQGYLCVLLGHATRGGINAAPNQTAPGTQPPVRTVLVQTKDGRKKQEAPSHLFVLSVDYKYCARVARGIRLWEHGLQA